MSDRRTVASAHERADAIEKELIELQTTVRIQLKDIYGRIKLSQNILLTASGSIIVMLVTIITRMG
jgi:predicted FMN-binding regulatory protein PaiB